MRYLTIPGILRLSLRAAGCQRRRRREGIFLVIALTILVTLGYWQFELRRYSDQVHAEELEKAAKEAQLANEAKNALPLQYES